MTRPVVLRLCAVCVLLCGLTCAVALYLTAPDVSGDAIGYMSDGGELSPVRPEDSRSYLRSLEYVGGKSAVFAVELRERLGALWGRPALAVALGLVSAVACGLLLRAADRRDR